MAPVWKFSAPGTITTGRTLYTSMLAGNTVFNPWAPSGAYDSIATTTVGAGGASSITFSSIPSTYTHLQIRCLSRTDQSGAPAITIRFNSDSGNNYKSHYLEGNGSSAYAGAAGSINYAYIGYPAPFAAGANIFGVQIADILDYTNTNKYKTTRSLAGYDTNANPDGYIDLFSSLWMNTSAITSITIQGGSGEGYAQYSSFALYGIKGN